MMRFHRGRHLVLLTASAVLLSGCSWLADWPPAEEQARAPYPEEIRVSQQQQTQALVAPQSTEQMASGDSTADTADVQNRLAALEEKVELIRNDIGTMMPALTRLTAVQSDLTKVLSNVQPAAGQAYGVEQRDRSYTSSFRGNEPQPRPSGQVQTASASGAPQTLSPLISEPGVNQHNNRRNVQQQQPSRPAPQQQARYSDPSASGGYDNGMYENRQQAAPSPNISNQSAFVRGLRVGEHSDKTRIVLDISDMVTFSYTVYDDQNKLVVNLPGVSWRANDYNHLDNSPIVSSYRAVSNGQGGTTLEINLRTMADVAWADILSGSGNNGPRVVIDLVRI